MRTLLILLSLGVAACGRSDEDVIRDAVITGFWLNDSIMSVEMDDEPRFLYSSWGRGRDSLIGGALPEALREAIPLPLLDIEVARRDLEYFGYYIVIPPFWESLDSVMVFTEWGFEGPGFHTTRFHELMLNCESSCRLVRVTGDGMGH